MTSYRHNYICLFNYITILKSVGKSFDRVEVWNKLLDEQPHVFLTFNGLFPCKTIVVWIGNVCLSWRTGQDVSAWFKPNIAFTS